MSNILIPGDELRLRVASVPQSADDYRRVGNWNAEIIEAEFERHGVILADVGSLLDFGCGCGRTLQFLRERAPHVILHGSDIDEAAIAWCRETIPYARCDINQAVPPLNYADASFDAIIALSVFSHLDASMERQWFAELGRVLKPGGLLLISFSGPFVLEHYRDEYSPENLAEYEQTGFTFVRNITDSLFPAWYQTSLQNVAFIGKSLPEGLRIAGYLEQGLTGWQDLVMIRRNSDANRLTGAPVATSRSVAAARPTPPFAPALDSISAALAAPDSQAALRDAMFDAWRMMCADTAGLVMLRSTMRSARFVEQHIPLHLARRHGDLRHAAATTAPRDGLFLEFGVFEGNWINHFAEWLPEVTVYGFDSFEGLPENWSLHGAGVFNLGGALPSVRPNVELVKGWFSDSLPGFLADHPGAVSFVHIDCDLYSSTKTVLDLLLPRLRVGTQIVLDDFMQAPGWESAEFRAFFDFIKATGIEFDYTGWSSETPGCSVGVVLTSMGKGQTCL